MNNLNAILTIAYRDFLKFVRDRARLVSTFIFPVLFIGILGGSMQSSFGAQSGFDLLTFVFTGVLAQTLFSSTAQGIISLIEDRENDFSQEIFVAPVSRYAIILGKILGESLVAFPQGAGIILFGWLVGVPISMPRILAMAPIAIVICFFGGAFGLIVLANLSSQRAANQVFPFLMLPQYFLAGIFTPVTTLPAYLKVIALVTPMRYAVDLLRNAFYAGSGQYDRVVAEDAVVNMAVLGAAFAVFLLFGTVLFVRRERNR